MPHAQPVIVGRESIEPLDILIVTAADGEDDAVRLVEDGGVGVWQETPGPPDYGFSVWRRRYIAAGGGQLSVALTRAAKMGGEAAASAAARLVDSYRPQCLAMCGVCAGNPSRVQLGDVIIADRVWRYDEGALVNPVPGAKPEFKADTITHQLDAQWAQAAERFVVAESTAWLGDRPRSCELQADWVLWELYEGRDPLDAPERTKLCRDWTEVVGQLEADGLIRRKGSQPELTTRGRKRIEGILFKHARQLPQPKPWCSRVGPLGTGNSLVKDVDIWQHLERTQRHVLGLDMEGAAIGFTAHMQRVPYAIVVKGEDMQRGHH